MPESVPPSPPQRRSRSEIQRALSIPALAIATGTRPCAATAMESRANKAKNQTRRPTWSKQNRPLIKSHLVGGWTTRLKKYAQVKLDSISPGFLGENQKKCLETTINLIGKKRSIQLWHHGQPSNGCQLTSWYVIRHPTLSICWWLVETLTSPDVLQLLIQCCPIPQPSSLTLEALLVTRGCGSTGRGYQWSKAVAPVALDRHGNRNWNLDASVHTSGCACWYLASL